MENSRLCSLAWTVKHDFIIRDKGNWNLICKPDEIYVFIREMLSQYCDWFWGLPTSLSSEYQNSIPSCYSSWSVKLLTEPFSATDRHCEPYHDGCNRRPTTQDSNINIFMQ
jgi:hypothetical protein